MDAIWIFLTSPQTANAATVLTAIAAILAVIVAIVAARFALIQFAEMRQSRSLSAFITLLEYLQDEPVREARRTLIGLKERKKEIASWTMEEVSAADRALRAYNTLAIMVEGRLIPMEMEKLVLEEWGASINECWKAGQPLVKKYKAEGKAHSYWPKLERLFNKVAATST